jgi:hypothetical protein
MKSFSFSKIWILILLIILFVFIGGGIFLWQYQIKEKVRPTEIPKETELPKKEKLEISLSQCEKIEPEKEIERTLCFINLGKESKDINICNQISDIRERGYCYGGVAGGKNDPKICEEFMEKTLLYSFIEKLERNLYTPAELFYTFSRYAPLDLDSAKFSIFSINPPIGGRGIELASLASQMDEYLSTPCLIGKTITQEEIKFCQNNLFCWTRTGILMAVTKKDPKICDKTLSSIEKYLGEYEEQKIKEDFLSLCYGAVGIEMKNPDLCNKIDNFIGAQEEILEEYKAICFSYVARSLKDPEICEKISPLENPLWKEYCFFEVARTYPEIEVCNKIKIHQQVLADCYTLLAGILYNVKICEMVKDKEKCEDFFSFRLGLVKDPSVCKKLEEKENKENCYFHLALNLKEEKICEKEIETSFLQDDCYTRIAQLLKDKTICKKIQNSETKDDCYYYFTHPKKIRKPKSIGSDIRDTKRKDDIYQIGRALEMIYAEKGSYPQSKIFPKKEVFKEYLVEVPTDPGNGPCPSYQWINNLGQPDKYCIYACLENGKYFTFSPKGSQELSLPPKDLNCGR